MYPAVRLRGKIYVVRSCHADALVQAVYDIAGHDCKLLRNSIDAGEELIEFGYAQQSGEGFRVSTSHGFTGPYAFYKISNNAVVCTGCEEQKGF